MPIQASIDSFLVQLEADGRSPHTIGQYRRHLRVLATWLDSERHGRRLGDLDHEDLACFLASPDDRTTAAGVQRHPRTTNAIRTSVRGFFQYLHEAGRLPSDPTRLSRRALVGPPHPRPLSDAEVQRLTEALDAAESEEDLRDRILFRLMLGTGIRIGSALGLRASDVDLESGEIHLRRAKGAHDLRLPISDAVRDLLSSWMPDRIPGPLFSAGGYTPISTRHVQRRFAGWLERACIRSEASPHSLRHTFATRLYARTRDIHLVQRALGHRSIESTLVYARSDSDAMRLALAAE